MPIAAKQETGTAYDFNVNQVEFSNPVTGGRTGLFANIREDNNDILGVVTKRYSIVNNADVINRADSALEEAGIGFKREVYTLEGGRKMKATYDIGVDSETGAVIDERFTRPIKQKGDVVGFRLTAQNSFDRSLRISFALGLVRLVCTNGMTTMEKEVSMIKKHSANFNIDDFIAGDAISEAVKRLDRSVDLYRNMADIEVPQELGLTMLQNLTTPRFKKVLSEKAREGVARIWNAPTHGEDADRTLYNLNNAVTQYFTHDQDSVEYAQRTSDKVLDIFSRYARNDAKVVQPLITVPKQEDGQTQITIVE